MLTETHLFNKYYKIPINIYVFWLLELLVFVAFFVIGVSYSCPIKAAFGVDCLGCGMTRAFHYLLKGNVIMAVKMHYVSILLAGHLIVLNIQCLLNLSKKHFICRLPYWLIVVYGGLFLVNWLFN